MRTLATSRPGHPSGRPVHPTVGDWPPVDIARRLRHRRLALPPLCGARVTIAGSMWVQRDITLQPRPRGFHPVTREVVSELPELAELRAGLLHVHLQHTSASLTLNENASPEVRRDFETWFTAAVPESFGGWTHTPEGRADMPAHIKASLLGSSVTVPVRDGRIHLGTWQGIYLCEHRDRGGPRTLTLTLNGE
jgi:secondary thiamine-phosphate synthase enzyme